MATFNTYDDGKSTLAGHGANAPGAPAVDCIQAEYDATKRNLDAADVVELITIPQGTFVHKVYYQVLTADAEQTLNIGDGDAVDGYVAAADVGTVGNSGVGAGALATGKMYVEEDTLDLNVPATMALDTLRVRVVAMVTFFGPIVA